MAELTHFDAEGRAHMVDVGGKPVSKRIAIASGQISMDADTLAKIREGRLGKGDVLGLSLIHI